MKETGKERFILTKAYEVTYALFRLAAQMQEKDFAESLRASGTALLTGAAAEDYAAASRSLRVMECLVKFGGDVGMIGTQNVDVMVREIYALDVAIAERKTAVKTDEVNVAEIFSKSEIAAHSEEPKVGEPFRATELENEPTIMQNEAMVAEPYQPRSNNPAIRQSANDSAIRQVAILERIRQFGSCRLKDIQDILPNTSERTIRYDLQTLLEKNLIERIGNAGPSVFYRASAASQVPGIG
jgi:predicted MarR family transcription regulator